jgi:hypothetical protein
VADLTTDPPHASEPRDPATASGPGAAGRSWITRNPWWLVTLGVLVLSALLLRWANTRPGYDPYGWLDWGYQTLRLSLNLGGAPSWKPFTYIFTVPYSLLGHWALYLWMETAVAISLAGAIFAGRIAYRLTGAGPDRRWAAIVAAVFAGASVLGIQQYFHYILSAQSDPMLVTFCLAAIDCYLCKRLGWAWWLGVAAGLGRPEVWPFLIIFGIWLLRTQPAMRWMVFAAALVTLFLWFGVPEITNHRPNIAGQLALKSPRELHKNKIVGTIDRFTALAYLPVWLAVLAVVGLAAWRRDRTVLTLIGMAALWLVIEIAFVLHGFPGVPRYLFEAVGLAGTLAGIAVGWLLLDASKLHPRLPSWAGIPVVAAVIIALVPTAISDARSEHKDISHERQRTVEIDKLGVYVTALGGPKAIDSCGQPVNSIEYVSVLAWYLHRNTGVLGYRPEFELTKKHNPIELFIPLPNGWALKGYRIPASRAARCSALNSLYVPTARHPHGVLVPKPLGSL